MTVIGAHRSYFGKAVGVGLLLTGLAMLFITINHDSNVRKIRSLSRAEAQQYFNMMVKTSELFCDDITRDAAILFSERRAAGNVPTATLKVIARELALKKLDNAHVWFVNGRGNVVSVPGDSNSAQAAGHLDEMKGSEKNCLVTLIDGAYYVLRYSVIENRRSDSSPEYLVIAFPIDRLYAIADHDRRVVRIVSSAGSMGDASAANVPGTEAFSVLSSDTAVSAEVLMRVRSDFDSRSDISGWEMVGLGLLPALGIFLVLALTYGYFELFTRQLAVIKRLLGREKPGIEIFQRDEHVAQNDIPAYSEVFGLIDEHLAEKTRLARALDIIGLSLEVIRGKGFDQSAVAEIIEVIAEFTGSMGGAIFYLERPEDRIDVRGRFNFPDEILSGICHTPEGLNLLKASEKKGTGLQFGNLPGNPPRQAWQKVIRSYRHIGTMPLTFATKSVGYLVLVSIESDPLERLQAPLGEILCDLAAAISYGLEIETEKTIRHDRTRILQETSLAISSTLDLPSVLQIVATRLSEYAGATFCMILLNGDKKNELEVASFQTRRQSGIVPPDAPSVNLAEFPRLAEAMSTKRTLIFGPNDQADFSNHERRFFHTSLTRTLTFVPISHSARSIGVVVLAEERTGPRSSLSPEKLNFVQAVVSQAASAIENARLYGYINSRVDQLTVLYDVSAVLHSEMNINSILEKVLSAIGDYLHFSSSAVFPVDDRKRLLPPIVSIATDSESGAERAADMSLPTVSEKVASSGESLMVDDMRTEVDWRSSFPRALSELAIPVKIGSRVIGVLSVGSQVKCAFSSQQEDFLVALSAQISVAMERARLFNQERERGLRLKAIFEFSRKLSKSLNVREVLQTATNSIQEAFGYQLVAVFMIDHSGGKFYIGCQSSASDVKLPSDFAVPLSDGLLGKAVTLGKTIYCPDVSKDSDYVCATGEMNSEVCVPIIVADRLIGVLDVESAATDDFTQEDINTLEALSDIMAVAIDNSNLFEETIEKAERLALIDNINKAISATLDLDSFFKVVAKAVADNAGYRWTSLVEPEGDSFVLKAGYTAKSAGVIATEPMLEIIGDKLRRVIETASPEFLSFSQIMKLGSPDKLQSVLDAGIRNLALFPIGDSVAAEAVMIVGSARSDGFSHHEVLLLKDLAVHLRIAWQNAQLYMQLKNAYEQLQEAQERIVQTEKLRALGEMSSGVVHDFNNILAAILGRIQIITGKLGKYATKSGRQFLTRNLELIEKAATDGSHILTRIGEFTKKNPTEKFTELYVDQIIGDAIELVRPRWHKRSRKCGKQIDVEFHHRGNLRTAGNPSELREVFINLIINAVDAIPGKGKIIINAWPESEKTIIVTIEDSGQGMSPETRKKIFEPFFTTKGEAGTGLGLPVAYGIVTRHSGSIEVESEYGHGTKLTIRIPIRGIGKDESGGAAISAESTGHRGKILVVDDEEGFRDVLIEILVSRGYEADSVSCGLEALSMLAQSHYDLIITDLGMSGLSGWDLADTIYNNYPDVKIVMATGWGASIEKENLKAHHVHSMICKPFRIEEILRVVNDALAASKDGVLIG